MGSSRGVDVESEVTDAGEAMVDPEQLRQVLDNLVRNAIEATAEGGRVVLTVRGRGNAVELEVAIQEVLDRHAST